MSINDSNRRSFLKMGLLTSVAGFFGGAISTRLVQKSQPAASDNKAELVETFLVLSRDAGNYAKQIELNRIDITNNLKSSRPEKIAEIDQRFSDEFWNEHVTNVTNGFRQEIEERLSPQDLEALVEFFRTPAGQNYLNWKSSVQSRGGHTFKAVTVMQESVGGLFRELLGKSKDYKWTS